MFVELFLCIKWATKEKKRENCIFVLIPSSCWETKPPSIVFATKIGWPHRGPKEPSTSLRSARPRRRSLWQTEHRRVFILYVKATCSWSYRTKTKFGVNWFFYKLGLMWCPRTATWQRRAGGFVSFLVPTIGSSVEKGHRRAACALHEEVHISMVFLCLLDWKWILTNQIFFRPQAPADTNCLVSAVPARLKGNHGLLTRSRHRQREEFAQVFVLFPSEIMYLACKNHVVPKKMGVKLWLICSNVNDWS